MDAWYMLEQCSMFIFVNFERRNYTYSTHASVEQAGERPNGGRGVIGSVTPFWNPTYGYSKEYRFVF